MAHNCCLEPTACGTLTAGHNPLALARRGSTMRYADEYLNEAS